MKKSLFFLLFPFWAFAEIDSDEIYDSIKFPFTLSAHGYHEGMKAHVEDLVEAIDDKNFSDNLAKLGVQTRDSMIHRVESFLSALDSLKKESPLTRQAYSLRGKILNVWTIGADNKPLAAKGSPNTFKINVIYLYKSLDRFLTKASEKPDKTIKKCVAAGKKLIRSIEDAIIMPYLKIYPNRKL